MHPDNTNLGIPSAESITHQHIAAVINSFLDYQTWTGVLRVLDVGCGNGRLLSHIQSALKSLKPGITLELYGMDVEDAGQQESGYFESTLSLLKTRHPEIDWLNRLKLVTTADRWPYAEGYFDFILSNSVMEHVMDHRFVFSEIRRCLRQGGVSVNLFPVKEVLWEGHALMPLVHWVRDVGRRERLMLFFAKMGFTKHYHREMERRGWRSIDEFTHTFARVLETDTNYLTERQLARTAEGAGLKISFDYTKDFFVAKLLSFIGKRTYRYVNTGAFESAFFILSKRLSSVTVLFTRYADDGVGSPEGDIT